MKNYANIVLMTMVSLQKNNKSEEPINYPVGNLSAHFEHWIHIKELNGHY